MQMSNETANQLTPAAPATPPATPPPAAPPPPPAPPMMTPPPTSASHVGWIVLSLVLFIIGLVAGAGGGYYLGIEQTDQALQEQNTQYDQNQSGTTVDTQTDASSSNPLDGVQLNPFE